MRWFVYSIVVLTYVPFCCVTSRPSFSSDVYKDLLRTVQMEKLFEDSKTFVDMKMKNSFNRTMEEYIKFNNTLRPNEPSSQKLTHTRDEVHQFLKDFFESAGQEFENWVPQDWHETIPMLDRIGDNHYREWASHLHDIWKVLGRKIKDEVRDNDQYSLIWVPKPVIVPGGRFREFYYWDSYWIIQGLLHSEMPHTVRGMLENFAYMVDTYGLIPNGGRIYYMERSQPPLFIPMVKLYMDHTNDVDFLQSNIATLEKEFNYWMTHHTLTLELDGRNYTLATYGNNMKLGPRPESYSEDVDSADFFTKQEDKEDFYAELRAAAESGWDFSSRWFITNNVNEKGNLTHTRTRAIIPVDLNSMLHSNAVLLSEWYALLGDQSQAERYEQIAAKWLEAIQSVLWHDEVGVWLDYDTINKRKRDSFYPSNLAPLWTGSYYRNDTSRMVTLVLKYLKDQNVQYPGGIPTSREHTGEQWDFPNAWPPLQHMIIVGLNNTGDERAKRLALEMAQDWVQSNYQSFKDYQAMYEKYDATLSNGHGNGGEYEVQLGFGWTNGVILDLLHRYGEELRSGDDTTMKSETGTTSALSTASTMHRITVLMAIAATVVAGLIG